MIVNRSFGFLNIWAKVLTDLKAGRPRNFPRTRPMRSDVPFTKGWTANPSGLAVTCDCLGLMLLTDRQTDCHSLLNRSKPVPVHSFIVQGAKGGGWCGLLNINLYGTIGQHGYSWVLNRANFLPFLKLFDCLHTVPPESIDPVYTRSLHASWTRYSRTQPRLYLLGKPKGGVRPGAAVFARVITLATR